VTPQVSFFAHRRTDVPVEIGKYVISHNTMNYDEYIEGFLYKYFIILMHSLGWANIVVQRLSETLNIPRSQIYTDYYNYIKNNDNFVSQEFYLTKQCLKNTIEKNGFWGRQLFGTNDLYWEYESASAITFEQNRDEYFSVLKEFIGNTYGIKYTAFVELNDHMIIAYDRAYPYFIDEGQVDATSFKDFQEFCKAIWHRGRRTKQWKTKLTATQSGAH
jgi:hypothetical protein